MVEKLKAFEEWLQRRDMVAYGRYLPAQKMVAKQAVKFAKEWRTGEGEIDWGMISRVTKRCFGKR